LRTIKRSLGIAALLALAAASAGAGSAAAATQGVRTKAQWQAAIGQARGSGCYHASYPALQWHAVRCAVAPKFPVAPRVPSRSATRTGPATVGNGVDYSAVITPGIISQAIGTFKDVSSGITETGKVGNAGSKVKNAFSLQLNTSFMSGNPACSASGDPANCLAWQQFVYDYQDGTGFIFMQYWLINYDATCPTGWMAYSTDCYANSPASTVAQLTAKELGTLKLTASATKGGNDKVSLSVGSGAAATVSNSDSVEDLAKYWNTTEWDVFGDGGGGEAFFSTDTTLEAETSITASGSSSAACMKEGFTAETNNLKLAHTPALGSESKPTLASRQTNGTAGTASCVTAG
jgi:hypothetical protein